MRMTATSTPASRPQTASGRPFPLGPTICREGINFSLFSANATMVGLLLFDGVDGSRRKSTRDPAQEALVESEKAT